MIFRLFSARAGRFERRRGELRKMYENQMFFHEFRVSAFERTTRRSTEKSSRTRFSSESCDGSLSKEHFFGHPSLKIVPEGSPGCLGSPPGATLGLSWALLGRSWSALGRSWAALGGLLGALGAILGALGRDAFSSWALLDPPGRFWLDF